MISPKNSISDSVNNDNNDDNDNQPNFLTQLEYMMGVVKEETGQIEFLRQKVRDQEFLRQEMSARLIDLESREASLKADLAKMDFERQEAIRAKALAESVTMPIKLEINKLKEMYQKEKAARQAAQTENINYQETISNMQRIIDELSLQTKADKALLEQGRLTQEELNNVRMRAKKEISNMQGQINHLQKSLSSALSSKKKILTLAQEIIDVGDDNGFNEFEDGVAGGRYVSPMRRYSFDDTSYSNNNYSNNNNCNNNNNNGNHTNNNQSISNNHSSSNISYESPSTSPRLTNETKDKKKRATSAKKKSTKKSATNEEYIYNNTNTTNSNHINKYEPGEPYKISKPMPFIRPNNLPRI